MIIKISLIVAFISFVSGYHFSKTDYTKRYEECIRESTKKAFSECYEYGIPKRTIESCMENWLLVYCGDLSLYKGKK
jgi:hypothetical protein